MPDERDLPESLQKLCSFNAIPIRQAHYDEDVNKICAVIKKNLPNKLVSFFDTFVECNIIHPVLTYSTITALVLFIGVMLKLNNLDYSLDIHTNFAGDSTRQREVGFLLAVNWSIVMLFITPLLIHLFHSVMHEAKVLLKEMEVRKMIVYINASGDEDKLRSSSIWNVVLQDSSKWFLGFFVIAVIMGVTQWYMYSGSFYHESIETIAESLNSYTGVDWNVGWVINKELNQGHVVIFTLFMYLLYGIGWWVTFSFYIFLFNFFSEIESMSGATRVNPNKILRLDSNDADNGGFGLFYKIQRHHSYFCMLSIVSMFLMSFRNTYLQNVCKVPETVSKMLSKDYLLNQCDSMVGFASRLIHSISAIFYSPGDILNILFFPYAKASNPFVIGSFLQVGVIAGFFYFITLKMENVIDKAKRVSNNKQTTMVVLQQLKRQNIITMIFLITGGISTIFLNFILIPLVFLILILIFFYLGQKHTPYSK